MTRRAALAVRDVTDGQSFYLLVTTKRGTLTLPKGRVERGETTSEGAFREAREEAGVCAAELTGAQVIYRHTKANGRSNKVRAHHANLLEMGMPAKGERWRDKIWMTADQAGRDPRVSWSLVRALAHLEHVAPPAPQRQLALVH